MRHPDLAVPFRGERYAALDRLSRLIAPPYDVISPSERARYAALDAHNIVHVMLPEAHGDRDRYAHAAEVLTRWRSERQLVRDSAPAAYVLAQDFALPSGERRSRVGVFVALAAEGYEPRRVRPHERTHAGPKADRLALLRATQTSLESIFVLAPDADGALAGALRAVAAKKPDAQAELNGVGIRLWAVPGAEGAALASLVNRGPVYIADGHHRYETASSYAGENAGINRLIALVVSAKEEGLAILPTHRVIYGAPVEPSALTDAWRETFDVADTKAARAPASGGAWAVVWPGGRSQALTLKSTVARGMSEVDVIAIGDLVVRSIVQRAGTAQIVYQPDDREAIDAPQHGATASVLMPAAKVETVFAVADANGIMPPKSTYFIPKVPAGVVLADWR
jgi:uncharacterized protein (DUF1015 family)